MTKELAQYDHDTASRRAMRRYEQGSIHARQGRTDLYGICEHYDAGFEAEQDKMHEAGLAAFSFVAA